MSIESAVKQATGCKGPGGAVVHAILSEREDAFCRLCGKELGVVEPLVWVPWGDEGAATETALGEFVLQRDDEGVSVALRQGSEDFSQCVTLANLSDLDAAKNFVGALVRLVVRATS